MKHSVDDDNERRQKVLQVNRLIYDNAPPVLMDTHVAYEPQKPFVIRSKQNFSDLFLK